jgi:hypothetical protein
MKSLILITVSLALYLGVSFKAIADLNDGRVLQAVQSIHNQ